jgi:hypothetical protein
MTNPAMNNEVSTLLPLVQRLSAAQGAEQGLTQSFNAAGGAQRPIGGLLARLGSVFTGAPAGNYGAQAQQAQQVIGNALGQAPSTIATPQIGQNQVAAQQAVKNIQNLIQTLMVPTNTGGSLMSAVGG